MQGTRQGVECGAKKSGSKSQAKAGEALMDKRETLAEVRRRLCEMHGYDQNMKYLGRRMPSPTTRLQGPLRPRDFLDFALQDSLSPGEERNRCNCLGNCKRAIDCQIDHLIDRLGFLPLARKDKWKMPQKIEFISQMGVVAPRILRRVNQLRNRLEHEFDAPSAEKVEDALDVATLFVSYAELVRLPVLNFHFHPGPTVEYDYEEMVFHFFDKDPADAPAEEVVPRWSLAHGEEGFQDFYDFLTKTVPAMERGTL